MSKSLRPPAKSSLTWETGTLVFRNTSLSAVKKLLEKRYGTAIGMYHKLNDFWVHEMRLAAPSASEIRREIRVKLYLYWDQLKDSLTIRGVQC